MCAEQVLGLSQRLMAMLAHGSPTCYNAPAVSQLAVAQQRLSLYEAPFWPRLMATGVPTLGARECANALHASDTLASGGVLLQPEDGIARALLSAAGDLAFNMIEQ